MCLDTEKDSRLIDGLMCILLLNIAISLIFFVREWVTLTTFVVVGRVGVRDSGIS